MRKIFTISFFVFTLVCTGIAQAVIVPEDNSLKIFETGLVKDLEKYSSERLETIIAKNPERILIHRHILGELFKRAAQGDSIAQAILNKHQEVVCRIEFGAVCTDTQFETDGYFFTTFDKDGGVVTLITDELLRGATVHSDGSITIKAFGHHATVTGIVSESSEDELRSILEKSLKGKFKEETFKEIVRRQVDKHAFAVAVEGTIELKGTGVFIKKGPTQRKLLDGSEIVGVASEIGNAVSFIQHDQGILIFNKEGIKQIGKLPKEKIIFETEKKLENDKFVKKRIKIVDGEMFVNVVSVGEEKVRSGLKEKRDEKVEEKTEEKIEEKIDQKVEEKTDEKVEEKTDQKVEEKTEEKVEEKDKPSIESAGSAKSPIPRAYWSTYYDIFLPYLFSSGDRLPDFQPPNNFPKGNTAQICGGKNCQYKFNHVFPRQVILTAWQNARSGKNCDTSESKCQISIARAAQPVLFDHYMHNPLYQPRLQTNCATSAWNGAMIAAVLKNNGFLTDVKISVAEVNDVWVTKFQVNSTGEVVFDRSC